MTITWVLNAAIFAAVSPIDAAFIQYLVTVGVFPILAWLLVRWQRTVLAQV